MKLIIQIPAYNEEATLPVTLSALPKTIEGIDEIEVLLINDGSTDDTVLKAKEFGVKEFVNLPQKSGLARAFSCGIKRALELNADIIVNTDADNQYCAADIVKLIRPILNDKADISIGTRPINNIKTFSLIKKMLQKFGSLVVRIISSMDVEDATSGFRAFSRNAAIQLNIFDEYTYTLETIIQAKAKGLHIFNVPVRVNPELRKSKLIKNDFDYILRSLFTMLRMFIIYSPFKFFISIASTFLLIGFGIGIRFLYFYFTVGGAGHVQSLILAAIMLISGIFIFLIAVLSDLLSVNRKILEDIQKKLKG